MKSTKALFLSVIGLLAGLLLPAPAGEPAVYPIGLASKEVSPTYPIRLSGYGGRTQPSEGKAQALFAKALAIGSDKDGPAVLLTLDNVATTDAFREELVRRLARQGVTSDRLTLSCSHTHTAPMLSNACPFIFGADIPADQQQAINRYTVELLDDLEAVALAALRDRQPGRLLLGRGTTGFARNRRPQGGPSDHAVNVLAVEDKKGQLRAVVANYACHCTTMGGDCNQFCADWAGFAREALEKNHPGAQALITIGCGADHDPNPRTGLAFARQNGESLARAVEEALRGPLLPVTGPLACQTQRISLPYDTLPTREQWQARAANANRWIAYHAKQNMARLDRGEKLPTELPYLVQSWAFGDRLAMLFLPGEVVVDYALRAKKEYDPARLWVTAYANEVPCYIPSRRVWEEGGYEGGDAMIYFDRPVRFQGHVEELVFGAIREVMPPAFKSPAQTAANKTSQP